MLKKPSPLKHLEDDHATMTKEAHEKAHLGEGVVDDYEIGGTFTNGDRSYIKQKDGWHIEGKDGETKLVNQDLFREHQLKGSKPKIEKEEATEEKEKSNVLNFDKWHTNKGGEKTMVEKLQEIHGDDYEITEEVAGDDVVGIKRKGDAKGIQVRLQTSWTDNADHSAGYRQYLDYVGGQNVDKTLNNYHDKTIGKHKITDKDGNPESDEAFFERTKPTSKGGYSPYTEIGGVRYHSGVLPSAGGKRSSNPYRNANGGEATEEEKVMYEEMKFLHDLKKRSDERKSKSLSKKNKDSNIVAQSKITPGTFEEGLVTNVGEKTDFKTLDYEKFISEQSHADFDKVALEIYAAEKVKMNEAIERATNSFLPGAKQETQEKFQPQYDALEQEQNTIVEEHTQPEIDKLQKEINAGLHKDKNQEELNAELNKRIMKHLSGMQGKYDKVNEEANSYLNNLYKKAQEDPEGDFTMAMNRANENALAAVNEIQEGYFKSWKPQPNLISEANYDEISQKLDEGGFANMGRDDKVLALTKQWNMLSDKLDDNMDPTELAKAEKEFWGINYSKLAQDGKGNISQFLIKGAAEDQLGIFEEVINAKIKENDWGHMKPAVQRQSAINLLKKENPKEFKDYDQVSRYLEKVIKSPETMDNSGLVNFWRGFSSKQGHEYLPFVSGMVSTFDNKRIRQIDEKLPEDRTASEKTLLSVATMKNETAAKVEEMSNAYNAGGMTADMLPFMGEMIATSGLAGTVSKAATAGSRAFLFPKALRLPGQAVVNVAEGASKTFGYLMGNLARTAVSPQRYMDQTYQNMTSEMGLMLSDEGTGLVAMVDENSGDDFLPAFRKGFLSTWAEYVSEGLGEKLPGVSRYMRKKLFGDPDWMKRISLGRYMRKKGLQKSEAATHFLSQKVGYNGVFGEIAEEIINTPMQNLINGQEFAAGMDLDFYKELAISMSATGFVFSGGSMGYNAMKGNKQSSYHVDGRRYKNKKEAVAEVKRLRDAGLLTANTDIEINNDFEAYDEVSDITDEFGFKGLVKSQSGTSKAIEDKITATELEVADAIANNNTPEKTDKLMKELEALELQAEKQKQQKELIAFDESIPEETRVAEVQKLQQRIDSNNARRKAIIDPYVKRIEAKKKLKLYKENVANVQKRSEQLFGKEMPVIEANSEQEAAGELSYEFDQEINSLKARLSSGKSQGPAIPAIERVDNEIRQQIEELEKQKADLLKGFDKVHGFLTPAEINGKKIPQRIIINKNYSLKAGAINVAGHEFFHRILQSTIRQNPETAIALGGALGNVLKSLDPKQFRDSKLRARLKGYQVSEGTMRKFAELEAIENELGKNSPQWKAANAALQGGQIQDSAVHGEETLNLLSDALASGDLQYNETLFTKIGDAIRRALSAMGIQTKFNSGRDVFNFIKDYNRTIASGKAFDRGMYKTLTREGGIKIGGKLKEGVAYAKEQVEDFAPGARGVYFSKDDKVTEADIEEIAMNPETGKRYTNEGWVSEGVNDAYMKLVYGDMLNGLMRNIGTKLQGDNVFNYPISEFFTELKQELDTAIMGFKPESNDNFSGWIGFHVAKKKPGVLDKFKKRSEEKKGKPEPTTTQLAEKVPGGIVIASKFGEVNPDTGLTIIEELVDKAVNTNFRTHKDPKKYKEVKQSIVSVQKIKDPKTGKMKSPSKVDDVVPTGPLYPVLKIFAKEFGIDPRKILGNIALTKAERRKAQQALNKLGVRTTLQIFPEGFTESGDATGMPTSILNAVNPETGEANLLYTKIGRKQNLDLQKKNNIDSINIAAASNVFGITQMGEMNRFDTENRLVDGPLRTVVTQLATLAAGQSMVKQAEADGNFTRFASIKDGKSGFAMSMDTLSDLDLDRRLEFLNKVDGVLSVLKPGFGKNIKIPTIIDELKKSHGDLFTEKEYKKIATEMKGLFDSYQPKTIPLPDIREEAWAEMIVDMKEDPLDGFLKFLGINEQATKIFDNEVNINKMRQSVSALGNHLLEQGMTLEEVAEVMIALQPAYSGNTQISRKKNYTVIQDPTRSDYGHAYKISEGISKKEGMSSPRNQSFESINDFIEFGVMRINGMTDAVWDKARNNVKLKKQDAAVALKNINTDGSIVSKTEIEADAERGRTALDHMMDFLVQSENHDVLDVGMFLVSNLSHMEAPIRRAAMFTDVVEGLTDPKHKNYVAPKNRNKTTVVYEHSIPANEMAYRLAYYKLNNEWSNDFWNKYTVAVITKKMDDVLKKNGLQSRSNPGFVFKDPNSSQYDRYYGPLNYGEEAMLPIKNIFTGSIIAPLPLKAGYKMSKDISAAIINARTPSKPKGITVLDFDDTLATSKSKVISTAPDGTIRKLTAEEFAKEGADLLEQGWKHDFSEFNKVVDGKIASLFNKAMKLQGKFGPKNMFVLTARPQESAKSIYEFLKANGLNIPIKNITGLANSTAEAKALWMADKVADGYNDFYFADDALQNVQAVKNMLDQFDVKSKVQQAKVKFSKDANTTFNNIIEATTGVESQKEFSNAQAKLRGQKTKYKSIIPASAQDFQGLLYNFLGKGKKGEADMAFFKKALIDPFARGVNELNSSRQTAANDFESLNKKFPKVKKLLNKKIEGLDYTYDQAARVYLWDKAGFEIPGLSKRDLAALTSVVENNPELQAYTDTIGLISKKDNGYSEPKDYWLAESIASDLLSDGAIGDKRSDFLGEWIENKNMIFSPENLNKIEAIYGSKFREALEDMLYRMETGRNRPMGGGRLVNAFMNWTNNSVGAIMFLNLRSATLQTISAANYMNWTDNNPAKAAAAFANQPQFWRDFSYIFNSDYLKQRRSGNQRGINEAELSEAVAGSDNKAKAAIAWLLKKGFTPTQIADSFAISMGGSTFYRNRIKKYVKDGMSQKDAEAKAWLDFQETTEVNQQSARPDMISQQQASPLGRLILAFQNTPMQYARIMNKATRDLVNGRGDYKTHISKIAYYGVAQSIIFGALQSALYASLGDDDEEDFGKKKERILNQMVDSWLTGIGYGGKAIGTVKNTLMEYFKQRDKGFQSDHAYTLLTLLSFSPPIGSKLRKIYSSIQTEEFNRGVFSKRGFTLDNPIWSGVGNVVEGVTNVPLGRMSNMMLQLDNAMDPAHKWWQRVALLLGQNTWDLGIKDPDIEAVKDELKEEKKVKNKEKQKIKKEEKKKEQEEANKAIIEENKKKSKKDGVCSAIGKGGNRCGNKVVSGKSFCTVHEKTTQRADGKETRCKKTKKDGKRCGMQTSNKSGYCYYHD